MGDSSKKSKYKLVVFDLDGTLLDSAEGIIAAMRFAIDYFGKNMPEEQVLASYIGPPVEQTFATAYNISGKELENMALTFRNRYKGVELFKAVPYDGIYELCQELLNRNIRLAIATYKREDYALKIIKHFGFDKYMTANCGADFENKLTKSDIIKKTIAMADIANHDEVVMVGDTKHDAEGAAKLGLDFIGVTYGFGFKNTKDVIGKNVVGVARTPKEILDIVMGKIVHRGTYSK